MSENHTAASPSTAHIHIPGRHRPPSMLTPAAPDVETSTVAATSSADLFLQFILRMSCEVMSLMRQHRQ
jgi:hypothetical protein